MSQPQLQALYGLKWNPFSPDVPVEGLSSSSQIDSFCYRVENLVLDGGFAMVTGDPGTGKSVVMRLLNARLGALRELNVGIIYRPQSNLADFYRELGAQ